MELFPIDDGKQFRLTCTQPEHSLLFETAGETLYDAATGDGRYPAVATRALMRYYSSTSGRCPKGYELSRDEITALSESVVNRLTRLDGPKFEQAQQIVGRIQEEIAVVDFRKNLPNELEAFPDLAIPDSLPPNFH